MNKIYDVTCFYNEFDILELRLNILNDVVDKFVICECSRNHQGEERELLFEKNKERYAKFLDKIIYIKLDDLPPVQDGYPAWYIENSIRDCGVRGLTGCDDLDIIHVSDCDEIPDPMVLKKYQEQAGDGIWLLEEYLCYYYLNGFVYNDIWQNAKLCRFQNLKSNREILPSRDYYGYTYPGSLTHLRFSAPVRVVKNAGWHFTYTGKPEQIINKVKNICEEYLKTAENQSLEILKQRMKKGLDPIGTGRKLVYLDYGSKRLPDFVKQNKDRYVALGLLPPPIGLKCSSDKYYTVMRQKIVIERFIRKYLFRVEKVNGKYKICILGIKISFKIL